MDLVVGGAHLTQFFEALGGIADVFTESDSIWLSGPLIQPIAAEDVATMQERRRADLSADPSSFCSVGRWHYLSWRGFRWLPDPGFPAARSRFSCGVHSWPVARRPSDRRRGYGRS